MTRRPWTHTVQQLSGRNENWFHQHLDIFGNLNSKSLKLHLSTSWDVLSENMLMTSNYQAKKKTQHRHVNSWSSFSPWFSPCFPMVFPFVHHFSPQNSGGFWDPTWSKSRCQAEASQPHLGTAISPAVRLAMTGQWPMASFSIPQDLVKSCHRAGAHTCGLWQRFFSRIKDGRTWMDDPFGSFSFRRGLETKKQMDDFLGVSPEVSRWTPE